MSQLAKCVNTPKLYTTTPFDSFITPFVCFYLQEKLNKGNYS